MFSMELDNLGETLSFTAKDYLSESQIDIAKSRVKECKSMADNVSAMSLIDSFVRANGKADVEYETLFSLVQNAVTASSEMMRYSMLIKMNLPVVFMIAFYDYLVLTGVMSEDDIEQIKNDAIAQAMRGGPAKA